MLPEFPNFKSIELSDKNDIETITHKFPPYSDFNFLSMWSWDIKSEMRFSMLNDNLVVRFTDYLTGEPFYSFLGGNKVNDTVKSLLELSEKEGLPARLKLVPEDSIKELDINKFSATEDRNHFDYILDVEKLQKHEGKKLRYHFNLSKRLIAECGEKLNIKAIDLSDEKRKKEILALTNTWIQNKASSNKDTVSSIEIDAIQRFFLMEVKDNFSLGVFYNNKLIGCSINDVLGGDYCLCHFMKADSVFRGIYSCLFLETSRMASGVGKKYINIEQDLGLSNLRQSKESFEPVNFLKKYIITIKPIA